MELMSILGFPHMLLTFKELLEGAGRAQKASFLKMLGAKKDNPTKPEAQTKTLQIVTIALLIITNRKVWTHLAWSFLPPWFKMGLMTSLPNQSRNISYYKLEQKSNSSS